MRRVLALLALLALPVSASADGLVFLGSPTAAPSGAAAGDLSGTYPNPTVAKTNGTPFGSLATAVPGTGVATALGTNVGSAGSVVVNGGALGTPSSGIGTNLTALNASNLSSGTTPAARSNGHQNGTATNDNAAAGEIGEFITATGSSVPMTSGTPFNTTAISVTAGDWDVWGYTAVSNSGATTYTIFSTGISLTNSVLGASVMSIVGTGAPTGSAYTFAAPMQRISVASTTTVFLVGSATFSGGTPTASGAIYARRAR